MNLPDCIWDLLDTERCHQLRAWDVSAPEELRFRIGQSCSVISGGITCESHAPPVTARELDAIMERAVKASFYAHGEELRQGYLHISSGVRLGICGSVFGQQGSISGIRAVTSVSIRIPREVPHCADEVFPSLIKDGFRNTLIISPPGFGKTTLLRSLIRLLSESGTRVAVADERGEISALSGRTFGFDLGTNTDVLSGGVKSEIAMMLMRSMNPQILAFDEITAPADITMITKAAGCGVALLATAHGEDLKTMRKRSLYRELFDAEIFETVVRIEQRSGKRFYVMERL